MDSRAALAGALPAELRRAGKRLQTATPARVLTSRFRLMPTFLIIGAMKAGTTSLYRYLAQHPRIAEARQKEVHFFDWHFARGPTWYRGQFPAARTVSARARPGEGGVTGEATATYLSYPHAPGRVRQLLPGARLVVLLRNPVDRAYSHYQHERKREQESLSFEDALRLEPHRLAGELERMVEDEVYHSPAYRRFSYMARGLYADQLGAWMDLFPPEQLLVVLSEDFFRDPRTWTNHVLDFLQLPTLSLPTYEPFLQGRYKEPMAPETREWLVDYFRPHNRRLASLLGRDPGWDR